MGNMTGMRIEKVSEEELERFKEFRRNIDYFNRYKEEIRKHYANSFVAIYECNVVESAGEIKGLMKKLAKKYSKDQIDLMYKPFVYREEPSIILKTAIAAA